MSVSSGVFVSLGLGNEESCCRQFGRELFCLDCLMRMENFCGTPCRVGSVTHCISCCAFVLISGLGLYLSV